MKRKKPFGVIILTLALIATYAFYNNKAMKFEQNLSKITQEYKLKFSKLAKRRLKDSKKSNIAALEALNNQLIQTRSALTIANEKLLLATSKAYVLDNEMSQISDARDEVKILQGSLQFTQQKLDLSASKIQYLETIFKAQNKVNIIKNIARIKALKSAVSGIAITGLIIPVIGVATLASYTAEEIDNYCDNIQSAINLESKILGKVVSLDSTMQSDYHNQCEVEAEFDTSSKTP